MNGLVDTIRSLRRGKRALRVCPKCGSVRIRSSSLLGGWIVPDRYVCDDCGYAGYLLLELEKEE